MAAVPAFYMLAYTGGAMSLPGWRWPVVIDLAGLRVNKQQRPVLRGHDPEKIVGHADRFKVGASALEAWGVLSGIGLPPGREVAQTAAKGFHWKVSVGAQPLSAEFVEKGERVTANGSRFDGPLIVIRQSELMELSFVPIPADEDTRAVIHGYTPARAARPPARGGAAKPRESIVGRALVFGKWMEPNVDGTDFPLGTRVRFMEGAFDRHLRRVERGKASVGLWFEHLANTETASTRDGTLNVVAIDKQLLFCVNPKTRAARVAIDFARDDRKLREASIGAEWEEDWADVEERGFVTHVTVYRARLHEISLVRAGACPGVWVKVK